MYRVDCQVREKAVLQPQSDRVIFSNSFVNVMSESDSEVGLPINIWSPKNEKQTIKPEEKTILLKTHGARYNLNIIPEKCMIRYYNILYTYLHNMYTYNTYLM